MTLGHYVVGLVLFAVTAGAALAVARIVVARRLAGYPRHVRGAAFGLLAAAALIFANLIPALFGVLGRASVPLCALALLAVVALQVRRVPGRPPPREAVRQPLLSRLLAFTAAALVAGWSVAAAWLGSAVPSDGRDTLTFHLPDAIGWLHSGTIWRVDQFEPLLATGYYPQNGDVLNLALLVPFHSEAFVRVLGVSSLAVMALAVYALARELGAPPSAAAIGAAVLASLPISVLTAEEGAKTDLWCVAALAAGGMFLVRHLRGGATSDLLLGGLGLGLALGTKWYGVTAALAVAAAWLAAWLLQRRPARRIARDSLMLAAVCAVAGGIWLVRNWVEGGNPLFPVRVRLAGITLWDAPPDPIRACTGYSVGDYLGKPDVVRHILWPIWKAALGPGVLLLLAGLVVAPLVAARRRAAVGLALVGVVLLAIYAVTPYSALGGRGDPVIAGPNVRYVLPALAVGAALLACALPRLGRLRHVVELLAVLAVANGLRKGLLVHEGRIAVGVIVGVIAFGAFLVVWRLPRALRLRAVALCVVALAVAGYVRERDFYDGRYRGADPALDILAGTPPGTRVGLAGFESTGIVPHVLPAFGTHLQNDVSYAGRDFHGQLRAYEERASFDSALVRGRYDYLLVARGDYLVPCDLPGTGADPGGWAQAAGWRRLTISRALALYRRP